MNLSITLGIFGCWLGCRVDAETSEEFSDGGIGVVGGVLERLSNNGSVASWYEIGGCVVMDFAKELVDCGSTTSFLFECCGNGDVGVIDKVSETSVSR